MVTQFFRKILTNKKTGQKVITVPKALQDLVNSNEYYRIVIHKADYVEETSIYENGELVRKTMYAPKENK